MTNTTFADLPVGMRAIQLPDPTVVSEFLDIFGRPKRTTTCECERDDQSDLRQSLHLFNSDLVHQKIVDKNGRVARLLKSDKNDEQAIEEMYLATLARRPDHEERKIAREFVASAPSRKEAFEDVLWALINCAEFSFTR